MQTETGALNAIENWRFFRAHIKRRRLDAEVSAKKRLLSTWAEAYMEDIGGTITELNERLVPPEEKRKIEDILTRRDSMFVSAPTTPNRERIRAARYSLFWGGEDAPGSRSNGSQGNNAGGSDRVSPHASPRRMASRSVAAAA